MDYTGKRILMRLGGKTKTRPSDILNYVIHQEVTRPERESHMDIIKSFPAIFKAAGLDLINLQQNILLEEKEHFKLPLESQMKEALPTRVLQIH
jgi:hypothetical protein